MLIKIHKSYRDVVSVCDSDLIGKTFQERNFKLQLTDFYKGEEKTEQEAGEIMKDMATEDATFNIVGEKSVSLALKLGIISEEGIKTCEKIPFSLVLL